MLACYGYGALPADAVQASIKVDGYVEVLEDAPLWAIEQASLNWRKRNRQNPPTSGQWFDAAKQEMGYFAKVYYGSSGEFELAGRVYEKLVSWVREAKQ